MQCLTQNIMLWFYVYTNDDKDELTMKGGFAKSDTSDSYSEGISQLID